MENKQEMLNEFCLFFKKWILIGSPSQHLSEIRYIKDDEGEWAVPIFSDGTGEPFGDDPRWKHGWYGVRIDADSPRDTFCRLVKEWLPRVD